MKLKVFILFLIIVFGFDSFGQLDRSIRPKAGEAPEIKIGDHESFVLENGLRVFVVENEKSPTISYYLTIDRSPILEGENTGYIDAAGQLLRTGTKNRTKDQLDEEIDFIGATFQTTSTSIFASSLKKHTESLLELMSDVLLNAEFKEEELEKIKKQTLSGLAFQKNDPNSIASNVRRTLVFGKDHPYGENPTEESVNNISLEMCKNYYEKYFSPKIAYMSVVGDISKGEAKDLIEKYFSTWQGAAVESDTFETPKAPLIRKVAMVDRSNSVQSVITLAYPVELSLASEDIFAARIANTILGGGIFSAKLIQNLREDKGYTYGAYSTLAPDRVIGSFRASCQARNEVTDSAVTQFLYEMKNMRSEKVSEEDLNLVKNYLTGSFSRSLESSQTIANFALDIERYNLPKDYYKNYLKNLNAVTPEEVLAASNKYIRPNNTYVIIVGKAEEVSDKIKKFSVNGKVDYYDIYGNEYDPSMSNIPAGLTADAVIENYISAVGGREKLEKIEDVTMKLKGKVQNIDINVEIFRKAPNKTLSNLDAGVMQQKIVFDGEKGKQSAMGQETIFEGEQLEEMKMQSILNPFLNFEKYGINIELTGVSKVNGNDAYRIVLKMPSGKTGEQYFDVNTGYKLREVSTTTTPQGTFTQTTDFDNYQEVEGVMFPMKVTQQMGPGTIDMEVVSVEINSGLEDALFEVN